jgi:hypothetical protein
MIGLGEVTWPPTPSNAAVKLRVLLGNAFGATIAVRLRKTAL